MPHLASNPQISAWVFASAGSGKTKILVDRVLRLLLEDVSPAKILCLTFTKVAAAEMESRINSALAEWVLCSDVELVKKLQELSGNSPSTIEIKKARTLFVKILDEEAKIKVQTIHSFCQSLIKIFPFEAKVSPNFELLEENREKLLLRQAQKEVMKKAQENESLKNLIKKINSKLHDEALMDLTSELISKRERIVALKENFFGIEGIVNEIFKKFSLTKNDNEEKFITEFLENFDRQEISQLASELETSGSTKNIEMANRIKSFLNSPTFENFSEYKLAFFTQKNEARKVAGKNADGLMAVMDEQRQLIKKISDKFNSLKIANDTSLLLNFVDQILQNYAALKKQNSFLDYNDLIIETNRLLANPDFSDWIKMKMDSNFDHILIDESQDTNQQQWAIIKALSEDFFSGESAAKNQRSIFIVGDEKQSIFSFQGAEPDISARIFSYFAEKLGENLKKIELNNSYRSTTEILAAVDKVFSDSQRKNAISKVSEFKAHRAVRSGVGLVEIWPQVRNEKAEKEEKNYEWKIDFSKDEEQKEKEILARITATKIKNWIENKRIITAKQRPINYGDIMILLRTRTNGFLDELVNFFHQYQIPFSSISRIKFSENLLVQDLLAAAKFALLPHDDLNLACLLKSPIFGISEEDLLEICLKKNAQQSTIYGSLDNSNLKTELDEIIEKSQNLNCFEFFYFLLHEKNHQQNFISYFGDESLEILNKFTLLVFDFYKNFSGNLQKFLEFVEKIDPEISLSDEENNRVKITTVHGSKGLQAPVVMLLDCSFDFNKLQNHREEISWLNNFPLWCSKKSDENEILKEYRATKKIEVEEEYLRLLYVAMTRAEDELYIGGFGKSRDPKSWYEIAKNALPENLIGEEEFYSDVAPTSSQHDEIPATETRFNKLKSAPQITRHIPSMSQINPAQIKGRLIHKILEIFGKNHREEKKWLKELTEKIIAREEFLNEKEKNEVSDLALNFLASQQFEEIFSGEVNCEIELTSNETFGRVDLLIEKENEILIIDYKSDETLPDVIPDQYQQQLLTYKKLAEKIYAQKKIRCAILWLRFLQMQMID